MYVALQAFMSRHNNSRTFALLLRSAAVLVLLIGAGVAAWLVDKAIRYPEIHARQFEASAPLWLPMTFFVVGCVAAAAFLFLRAARRIDQGEDFFNRPNGSRPPESLAEYSRKYASDGEENHDSVPTPHSAANTPRLKRFLNRIC